MTAPPAASPGTPGLDDDFERRFAARPSPPPAPAAPPATAPSPLRPVARYWPVVLVACLLFAGGGAWAALARSPTYIAAAELSVGRIDVRVQALPGYVAGAATLANAYSRVVETDAIAAPVARRTGRSRADVAASLTAAPVPENPILRITGTGADEAEAMRLADAASRELERYVARTGDGRSALARTLRDFRAESGEAAELRRRLSRLSAREERAEADATLPAPSAAERRRLSVAYETARLQADALGQMYRDRRAELSGTAGIQVISRPTSAADDTGTWLQRLVAGGLVAGLVVGAALALLLGARADRRARRAAA